MLQDKIQCRISFWKDQFLLFVQLNFVQKISKNLFELQKRESIEELMKIQGFELS